MCRDADRETHSGQKSMHLTSVVSLVSFFSSSLADRCRHDSRFRRRPADLDGLYSAGAYRRKKSIFVA